MAKSTRSKVKRSFRSKKRETGIYAATEAARLNRLHAKLSSVASREDVPQMDAEGMEEDGEDLPEYGLFGEGWREAPPAQEGKQRHSRAQDGSTLPLEQELRMIKSMGDEANRDSILETESMQVDAGSSKKISTHGPRGSRREEWRTSKGLAARPSPTGMNRQGGVAARRKAGRSKRRR